MKIKLAMLESDSAYLRRVVAMFNGKFAEELEIHSFTDTHTTKGECIICTKCRQPSGGWVTRNGQQVSNGTRCREHLASGKISDVCKDSHTDNINFHLHCNKNNCWDKKNHPN